MKKIIFGVLFLVSANIFAAEVAKDWLVTSVSVSTNTVTLIPTTALSGRTRVIVQNNDANFDISIGTFSTFTYGNGFIITNSTAAASSKLDLNLPSGIVIYGLGQAQSTRGTLTAHILEVK